MSDERLEEDPDEYLLVLAYGARAARAIHDVCAREQDWSLLVVSIDDGLAEDGPPRTDPFRAVPIVQIVDMDDKLLLDVAARHRREVAPDRVVTVTLGAPRGARYADGRFGSPIAGLPHDTHHEDVLAGLRALLAVPALLSRGAVVATPDRDGIGEALDAGHRLDVAYGAGATAVGAMSEALARVPRPGPNVGLIRSVCAAIELPEGTLRAASDAIRELEAAVPGGTSVSVSVSIGALATVALWIVS